MKTLHTILIALTATFFLSACTMARAADDEVRAWRVAQADTELSDQEQLKLAAIEGLMSASSERALPILKKVLAGNSSARVKSRALFVLGQDNSAEAQSLLISFAASAGPLQHEAIRMIGIGGVASSLERLAPIYRSGNEELRKSVLQAYLIANEAEAVYQLAVNAQNDAAFDAAVNTLGAMNATEQLRKLQASGSERESLIQAYAIARDLDSLQQMATSAADPKQRLTAIRNIGIVGGKAAGDALLDVYRKSDDKETREAVLQGMLIGQFDQHVLTLFRASDAPEEKRRLLRTLVNMNSDLALEVIDSTLEGN
ncbi:MAG: HEAT repeat domain-containing protein [Gammaproteobacteria bacterium]|nr:HEAT repeat domain-containing protein [Gammaproteobacteria bacterium]